MKIPLHPALVHIPLGLAIIMPFLTLLVYLLIKKGRFDRTVWLIPVIIQVVIILASFAAMKSGENEEDRVEKVVKEHYIEEHEEAAKVFLGTAILSLLIMGYGLKESDMQDKARIAGIILLFAGMGAVLYAGKLGGELVYQHGAASAYIDSGIQSIVPESNGKAEKEDDE